MKSLRIIFLGTPDIAVGALDGLVRAGHELALVVTQPDRRAGRGRKPRRGAVAAKADELGLDVAQPERAGDGLDQMAALAPDLLVTMAYGQILKPPLLDLPSLAAINVHTSLLPLLRGAAPINRAILQGHAQSGVTTMHMSEAMDAGDIIYQATTDIGPQETAGSLFDRLAEMGADLLVKTVAALAEGTAPRTPQDHAAATYAPMLTKAEGQIDWTRPAGELDSHVRGMDPWPAAYTQAGGKLLKLYAPTREISEISGRPGEVMAQSWDEGQLIVACGEGGLALGQVQAAGKKRMAAAQFLNGSQLKPGTILGE